ncbi:MAG: hydrogenase maturation protease [Candidatus Neomarinimicrobiota bacterium]
MKIIAVGNSLYGDDGVGEAVLNALADIPEMEEVELIDGATDALGLIDYFADTDHVVIIDAASMDKEPGTVQVFNADQAKLKIRDDHLSLHGISLAETFEVARLAESMPNRITIIGIEPQHLTVAAGLSEPVRRAVPLAVSKILELHQSSTV